MSKEDNILYYVGNIPIRENNSVRLNLSESVYKKIAEIANKTKLPISIVIALQAQPCCKCGNDEITLIIPKNILSTKKNSTGRPLTHRLNGNKE